jgi:integrase
MRSGEIFGLRWQDVDLARRQLRIRGTLDAKTLLWMPTTKTADSARTVALPATAVLALTALRASSQPRRRDYPADLVFRTSTGGAVSPSNANKRVQRAAVAAGVTAERDRAGLAPLTFHSLRHAFTTALREAGADAEAVSKMLGHTSQRMTATYSHMTDRRREAIAELAEAVFAGG